MICYPWLSLGGAPNTAITLAKGLQERGHDVRFFTRSGGIYESRLREAGIPVISAPYSVLLPYMYHLNPEALRILRGVLDRYKIEIVHAFHPIHYILSLFAAPTRKIPVVFTAVWFLDPYLVPAYPGRVIFVADEFRDAARHLFGGHARELAVVPNRIDLDMFHPGIESGDFAALRNLPGSGWKIAFMSRVDHLKIGSLRHAVEAVRLLCSGGRDATLAIAGDGQLFGELEELAVRVNGELGRNAVRLLGTVVETPQFLSWADIVLGIGRCAWEGMACAKPTFVVGENGFAGLVESQKVVELAYHNFAGRNMKEPVSPDRLAFAIAEVLSDEGRYRALAGFARRYVVENLDYRKGAEKLERLYGRALRDPALSAGQMTKLFATNLTRGYLYNVFIASKRRLRVFLGRGRPEDVLEYRIDGDRFRR